MTLSFYVTFGTPRWVQNTPKRVWQQFVHVAENCLRDGFGCIPLKFDIPQAPWEHGVFQANIAKLAQLLEVPMTPCHKSAVGQSVGREIGVSNGLIRTCLFLKRAFLLPLKGIIWNSRQYYWIWLKSSRNDLSNYRALDMVRYGWSGLIWLIFFGLVRYG